ncbi:MAG: hypothetical protein PHR47_00275 [Candidatus Pacebacteria bacterium]|nr:hypothetical protein [Candidatus Paceibacterota bacterium]
MINKKIKKEYIIFTVILVIAMGGCFFGGIKYQESKNGMRFSQMQNGQMKNPSVTGQGMNRQKGGLVGGEILSKDEKSVVLKDRSGGSKIVFLSESTQFLKSVAGSVDDVIVGSNVTVTGNQNPDGSITAKIIQLSSQATIPNQEMNGQVQPVTK